MGGGYGDRKHTFGADGGQLKGEGWGQKAMHLVLQCKQCNEFHLHLVLQALHLVLQ